MIESLIISLLDPLIHDLQSLLMDLVAQLLSLIVTLVMISSVLLGGPVPKGENIIPDLQYENGEIDLTSIEIDVFELRLICGGTRVVNLLPAFCLVVEHLLFKYCEVES
jgi:hypothetical protein